MNTQSGSTIGIIILIIGIVGLVAYVIFAPSQTEVLVHEDGVFIPLEEHSAHDEDDIVDEFLGMDIGFEMIPEEELTPESFPGVQQYCLDIVAPQAGSSIALPFTIQGDILEEDCWNIYDNKGGVVFIERNSQAVAGTETSIILSGIEYPRSFTATLSGAQGLGNVDIIFAELDSEGNYGNHTQRVRIPVSVQ